MRHAWCILALLGSTLLLVISTLTDVQATPPVPRLAQAAPENESIRKAGTPLPQAIMAQSLPAPKGLSVTESVVPEPPPPARPEVIPLAPLPSYVWMPGYWAWNNGWQWVPGHWVQPPRGATTWMPGQWVPQGQHWVWSPGHWQ